MASRRTAALATLLGASLTLAYLAGAPRPLPKPAPYAGDLPPATPPAGVVAYQLPTGVTHRSAAFAYQGGSFFDKRDFAMTAVLVEHPKGDVLIDTGFGRNIAAHLAEMPAAFRAITSYTQGRPAAEQLRAAGHDPSKLRGIVLTHAHWDHVSGVEDFPGTPVLLPVAEHRFVEAGGTRVAVLHGFPNVRYEDYAFDGGPYLGFPASHDLYGDGAIVIVPAPGHTPGSVVVFVTLSSGTRYAFVGDLVWQREGITEREERPWLDRFLFDDDPSRVRESLLRVVAIAERFPDLVIAPAHDSRGFSALPSL